MSDDYLKIIPVDAHHVPPADRHANAIEYLEHLFPEGEDCTVEVYDAVQFIDQGANFEAALCPACGARLELSEWWYDLGERMEQDPAESIVTTLPCCSASVRLLDLQFDWPAGFARFELSIRNPNVSENLSAPTLAELEAILGCKLRQVRAHY
jgi:hypothetical protein